jgi:NADPH:quinone reductase-like Zn-dependent oxidoreductase
MKAVAYFDYGGPEVMRLADLREPVLRPGCAVVKIAAASINPVDWKLRGGILRLVMGRNFPRVMGADLAGTIHAIDGESDLKIGDAVFGFAPPAQPPGSLAEYCLVPLERLAPLPSTLSMAEAAALPCVGVTPHTALITKGRLKAGQRVLVNGCTGGIGHIAVQIAKAYGAHVTGTCRAASMDFARSLGVDEVVDYTQQDILRTSERFDQIVETASMLPFRKAKAIMAERGNFHDPDLKLWNIPFGLGSKHYHPIAADIRRPALAELTRLAESGAIRPMVGQLLKLEDAIQAIAEIERGKSVNGKSVFMPG